MAPERFGNEPERFEGHREALNLTLAFVGLELRETGKLYPAAPTATLTEAQERANSLKAKLRDRNVHDDVLAFCRAELVQKNYFHAVFEATKSVAEKIRVKTGFTSDGGDLVDEAFGMKQGMPALRPSPSLPCTLRLSFLEIRFSRFQEPPSFLNSSSADSRVMP